MKRARSICIHPLFCVILTAVLCVAPATAQKTERSVETASSTKANSDDRYPDGQRRWLPTDSVGVRYISGHGLGVSPWPDQIEGTDRVTHSPDGKYFFFRTHRGDLARDCNVQELLVYSVSDVVKALNAGGASPGRGVEPLRKVTRCHKQDAFSSAEWEANSAAITIPDRGNDALGNPTNISRFDIAAGKFKPLLDVPANWEFGGRLMAGQSMIYTLRQKQKHEVPDRYPFYTLTSQRLKQLLYGWSDEDVARSYVEETYVSAPGRPVWRLKSKPSSIYRPALSLSPDGRYAIAERQPPQVPAGWSRYDGISEKGPVGNSLIGGVARKNLAQFMLIDLQRGTEEPLLDAPTCRATKVGVPAQVLWSGDGRHAVLTCAALPLPEGGDGGERARTAYIVDYDVEKRSYEVLEPYRQASGLQVFRISPLKEGKEFFVERLKDGKPENAVYSYDGQRWNSGKADTSARRISEAATYTQPELAEGLSVKIRQGPNEPFSVVASLEGKEVTLTEPDPALAGVWMAPSEDWKWTKEHKGNFLTPRGGGLLLPREMPKDGGKIPLVIQADMYSSWAFRPDGASRAGYAAQALAARGMAVLNLSPTLKLEDFIEEMELAVAEIAKKYPIDLDRIGLVGFSGMGYLTRYTITHPRRIRPAAAVIADSYTGSYSLVMQWHAIDEALRGAYDGKYGGPFNKAKGSWLEKETSFNVDKVQTPVLFADGGDDNFATYIDTIGAFKLNKKPFEYLVMPKAGHQILAPRQREVSLTATVDWMAFWLLGKEIHPEEKGDRYPRWREMRKLHEQNQKEYAAQPKGDSPQTKTSSPAIAPSVQIVLEEMEAAGVANPGRNFVTLNDLGYKAMHEENDLPKAMKYLRWNVALFPTEPAIVDSLAEGLLLSGDAAGAIKYYTEALALERSRYYTAEGAATAARIVERLKADPSSISALQAEMRKGHADYLARKAAAKQKTDQ